MLLLYFYVMNSNTDTIYARAVPNGYSGVSLIRVSGPKVLDLFKQELKKDPKHKEMLYGGFYCFKTGIKIDQVAFCYFKGPRSFTGEDVVEIFPHGNPLIIENILKALSQKSGFRLANKGEFTQRALENKKMDLVQVEALNTVVHAKHQTILKKAQQSLGGDLSKNLNRLKQRLEYIAIQLELDIDFSEEELESTYHLWHKLLKMIQTDLDKMCQSWNNTKHLHQNILIGFFGKPNAGKSSLINNLIGTDRLIVSSLAGTTRDYIEISFKLPSGLCTLVDTAGLGLAIDQIDSLAMQQTEEILKVADFKVLLVDGGEVLPKFNFDADLIVATKKDLNNFLPQNSDLEISNTTLEGFDALREKLDKMVFGLSQEEDYLLTSERQYQHLKLSLTHIEHALKMIEHQPKAELVAFEVRQTYQQLQDLIGEYQPNEILNQIFQGFCIGK